jgi:hypothetical protein
MRKLALFLLCVLPPALAAQTGAKLAGPISGIVFDRAAGALRPMVGVPGASYLGDAIASGLESATVAPDGDLALAVSQGRLLLLTDLKSGTPVSTVLNALAGDRIAWSPDGASAAVYSSRAAQAQILRDLRANPAPGALIDVPGAVSALALSDAGDLVAGFESGVCLLAPGSAPRQIAAAASASALLARGHDLFAAAGSQIWLIGAFAESASPELFAGDLGAISGLQISADGKRLFAADSVNRQVRVFDLTTRAATGQAAVDVAPSELRTFGGRDLWLLNSDSNGEFPLYVLTGTGDPAAWFVPSGRAQ